MWILNGGMMLFLQALDRPFVIVLLYIRTPKLYYVFLIIK